MARPTISQRIALEGGEEIKRALGDIGKVGESAFAQLQKAGEKVNLAAPTAAIESATRRASTTVDALRQRLASTGSAAAQGGIGLAQFSGVLQATQARLATAVTVGARVGIAIRSVGTAFSGAVASVQEFGTGVGTALQSTGSTALKSAVALGAVPIAFFAIANSAAEAAAKIKEAAIAAGTSPQEYQKLVIAAEQMGGSEEKLVLALSIVNEKVQEQSQNFFANQKRLQDLRETMLKGGLAGRQAAEDFQDLKREMELFGPGVASSGQAIIDVDQALKAFSPGSNDAIERLKGFADEVASLETPAERSARVIEVFGRRLGPQLVELLGDGRKAIDDIGKRAESLGLIMSNTEFKIAKDMTDALALLRRSISATRNSMSLLFAPAINDAAELFTEAIARNRTSLIVWGSEIASKVRPVLLDLVRALTGDIDAIETGWIKSARAVILDLGAAIVKVTQTIIVPAFAALMTILQTVASAINGVFGTKLTAADVGVVLILGKVFGAFALLAGAIRVVAAAFGVLRALFASVTAIGNALLITVRFLGGAFAILRAAAAALASAIGVVPVAIAAVSAAIGFLAVHLVRTIDWNAFADRARLAFDAVIASFTGLTAGLVGQVQSLLAGIGGLWSAAVIAAQTAFTRLVAGAANLWSAIQSHWQVGVASLAALWEQAATAALAMFSQIGQGAAALWANLTAIWQAGIQANVGLGETLKGAALGVWRSILDGVTATWDGIVASWDAGISRVVGFLIRLRDFAVGVWQAVADAARMALGAEPQASRAAAGFSRGGAVFGAGTTTSDSIPAYLSNGEFVIRAAAVRKYGSSLFDALNRMRLDPGAFRGFAAGGLVRSLEVLMPTPLRFSEGGLATAPAASGSMRPINLTIGSESFAGLLAPDEVANRLIRAAVAKQIRSAGRKPSSYGSGR